MWNWVETVFTVASLLLSVFAAWSGPHSFLEKSWHCAEALPQPAARSAVTQLAQPDESRQLGVEGRVSASRAELTTLVLWIKGNFFVTRISFLRLLFKKKVHYESKRTVQLFQSQQPPSWMSMQLDRQSMLFSLRF